MNRKYLIGLVVAVGVVAVPFLAYAVMSSLVVNGNATIGSGYTSFGAPTDGLLVQGKLVVGSSVSDSAQIKSAGVVESTSGGFKFPDGTTQMTAASAPTISTMYTASGVASISIDNLDLDTAKVYRIVVIADMNSAGYIVGQMNGVGAPGHGYQVNILGTSGYINSTSEGCWRLDGENSNFRNHLITMTLVKPALNRHAFASWTAQMNNASGADTGEQDAGGGDYNSTDNVTSVTFKNLSDIPTNWVVYVYSN